MSRSSQYEFPLAELNSLVPYLFLAALLMQCLCGHAVNWIGELIMLKLTQLFPSSFLPCPTTKKGKWEEKC